MVIELLGKNLKRVKDETFKKKPFAARSWCRIGIQCLYALKVSRRNAKLAKYCPNRDACDA